MLMLSAIYDERHNKVKNDECHYAECRYAECRGTFQDSYNSPGPSYTGFFFFQTQQTYSYFNFKN
jgi:hypothetical protein